MTMSANLTTESVRGCDRLYEDPAQTLLPAETGSDPDPECTVFQPGNNHVMGGDLWNGSI
jgi:hypothetical protein